MAREAELFGTAFQVHGTWYLRHEGGQGVLVPTVANGDVEAGLSDGQAYRFAGSLDVDLRGCATVAHPSNAELIGVSALEAS